MVIDTSALIALLGMEPEAARLAAAIEADGTRLISAASVFEAAVVSIEHQCREAAALLVGRFQRSG